MALKGMTVFRQNNEDFTINDQNTAREFNTGTDYLAGENVYYQGDLYRFVKKHRAGAWESGDVKLVTLADESMMACITGGLDETDLNKVHKPGMWLLYDRNEYTNKPDGYSSNLGFLIVVAGGTWVKQVLYTFMGDQIYMRTGSTDESSWEAWNLVASHASDSFWWMDGSEYVLGAAGSPYYGEYDLNEVVRPGVYLIADSYDYTHTPNNDKTGILIVYRGGNCAIQEFIDWDSTYGPVKTYRRQAFASEKDWSAWRNTNIRGNLTQTDLNYVTEDGWWLLYDENAYTNKPAGYLSNTGFLQVVGIGDWKLQLLYQFTGGHIFKRRGFKSGESEPSWEEWREISGSGSGNVYNITNNYEFPSYSQTVNLTASPQITTDTNNYLASTDDTTDRTAAVLAMLEATGICNLGPGAFYMKDLEMPDGSTITGCGNATEIHMSGTDDGFTIKIGSHCCVRDLQIIGADNAPTFGETAGGRHGLLWAGDYTEHHDAPWRGMVSNVWISNFSGGGITCYDTGYGTMNALEVVNAYIWSCWAGINISYWSEFNKFTNVRSGQCRIGCVNNGGNNVFVNCDFSSNQEIAMLMDNSQGQSPNNTHGSCIGCVFNHTAHDGTSNSGTGIKILNCGNGFMFEGCQIFFSKIHMVDSYGIVINGCNFGYDNCDIIIENGGAVLFANNMHQGQSPISISGNDYVRFANCYIRSTGAAFGV